MEHELTRNLELLLAAYRQHVDRATATIARQCAGDGDFFARLKRGGGLTVRTYDRVVAWFARHWPDDAVWPTKVNKPGEEA
jgi:hypothetical protein